MADKEPDKRDPSYVWEGLSPAKGDVWANTVRKKPDPPFSNWTPSKKMWVVGGVLLLLIYVCAYNIMDSITEREISRIDTGNFGVVWNNFDGRARTLLFLAKTTLISLDYSIMKSAYDPDDRVSLVWAKYRHEPKKDFPPYVRIRVKEKPQGGLILFYQGDKEYLALRDPVILPEPFYKALYAKVRSGKYRVAEAMQDNRTPYYRPPGKVRGIKP